MVVLQEFSEDLTKTANDLVSRLNELEFHMTDSEVKLHNTMNEFIMLADNQFVENRVYEDDEADEDEKEGEDTKAATEENTFTMMKEAFTAGQEALKVYLAKLITSILLSVTPNTLSVITSILFKSCVYYLNVS